MSLKNAITAGLSGLSIASLITLNITGTSNFFQFIGAIVIIGLISSIIGFLIRSTKALIPILIGAGVAIICAIAILIFVKTNI